MNIFIISYDLKAPTYNRERVEKVIESLGTWCKYVSTTYLLKTEKSINEVNKTIINALDGNDNMIVCKVQKPICGYLSQKRWDWINSNI